MNPSEDKQSGSNKDNWMGLPHPGSPVLSHRLLNALRLDDIGHSKEARGATVSEKQPRLEWAKSLLNGVPTAADGNTCSLSNVRRVFEENA